MDIASFDFSILSTTGLMMMGVYLIAGMVDSVCGGGGLFTVPALMSIGLPPHMVVGTNQGSLVLGNVTAIYKYNKQGKIDWKIALFAVPFSVVGAIIGAKFNLLISERYLQIIMLILLPILAIVSFNKRDIGEENHSDLVPRNRRLVDAALIGLLVSIYHAFYGPASGMFYIACFAVILKYDVVNANGISKVILLVACSISAITYAFSGNVHWQLVLTDSITYIIGNYIGSSIALTKGARIVKPAFYFMLIILLIKLIYDYTIGA